MIFKFTDLSVIINFELNFDNHILEIINMKLKSILTALSYDFLIKSQLEYCNLCQAYAF